MESKTTMERKVCCFNVSTWTRIVAWFGIVTNLLLVMIYNHLLLLPIHNGIPSSCTPGLVTKTTLNAAFGAILVGLDFLWVLGLIISFLLLIGSVGGHPHYIKAWLVLNTGITVVSFVVVLVLAGMVGPLLLFLIVLIPNAFSHWVVHLHLKDIDGYEIPSRMELV